MNTRYDKLVKVSASSLTSKVAGAIAGIIREADHVAVQAIGAAAVNQAIKSIALACRFLEEDGIKIVFTPKLVDVEIDGKIKTAIRFMVERRVRDEQ